MSDEAARFTISGQVILDGTGYGYIRLAPAGEKWQITNTNVMVSTNLLEARVVVYIDYIGSQYIADNGSYSGSSGDSSDTVFYLTDGQPIFIEWSGGDAGSQATVRMLGWRSVNNVSGFRAVH